MKFKTCVDIRETVDVDVELDRDDIIQLMFSDGNDGTLKSFFKCLNNFKGLMDAVSDKFINDMPEYHKEVTYNFLKQQSERFLNK
jgi:hypothetical protein